MDGGQSVLLVPTTEAHDAYAGYIRARDDLYRVALACAPGGGRVDPASVQVGGGRLVGGRVGGRMRGWVDGWVGTQVVGAALS